MTHYSPCPPDTLRSLPANAVVIDVRTDMEHAQEHLSCAHIHVPLDQLSALQLQEKHQLSLDTPLYLLCRGGTRARQAAQQLGTDGYTNIKVIEGGIMACTSQGIKTSASTCKTPSLSLERQVRIAAGALVVIGSLLALTVTPLFAALPLAVGCGLVFAGITDRCGLALVLAHAPWNKIK